MKNNLLFLIILTCIIFTVTNCSHMTKSDPKNEKAELAVIGSDCFAMNLSSSYVTWLAGSCGGEMSGLPVYEDDLLFINHIKDDDDIPLFILHNKEDKTHAYYSYTKIINREYLYSVNNSIIQINFENKPEVWDWLEKTTAKEIKNIRTLSFSRDIEQSYFPLLKKIAKVNNHPGIFVQNPWQLRNILPMFQPDWLFIERWDSSPDKENIEELFDLLKRQKNLKTFCYVPGTNKSVSHYKLLSALPSLKNLILSSSAFNQAAQPALPENLVNLEEILIFNMSDEKINNISAIKELTRLRKLRIIGAALSENLDELAAIPRLTTLSFAGTKVENIQSVMKEIPSLVWFSFPRNISQEDFEAFITYNPQLEYCEFFRCENIRDITPLENLNNLHGLIIIDTKINDYSPLLNLKNPDFLVLPEKFFKEGYDTRRAELQKELPDSKLVCGTPFCLGSGWIVLIPFIAVLCLVIITGSKKMKNHTKETSIIEK